MARLERRVKDCKATSPYLRFASNVRSQGGEDGVLRELFRCLWEGQAATPAESERNPNDSKEKEGKKRVCVDIGAWDGEHLSNTYNLIVNSGWGGVLVEADPERCDRMRQLYCNRTDVACVNEYACFEGSSSLCSLLDRHAVPFDFEFLSIDIDGADYHLWNSLRDSSYRPCVVCVEFNPSIPNDIIFVQERNSSVNQGSSLLALRELGEEMGYRLVVTTLFNAIFVRIDLAPRLQSVSDNLDDLHSSSMVTEMFQTYDGELKFVGPRKLIWHRVSINPERMQPLTRKQRQFLFRPGAAESGSNASSDGAATKANELSLLDSLVQNFAAAAAELANIVVAGDLGTARMEECCERVMDCLKSLLLHCESIIQLPHCEEAIFDAATTPVLVVEVLLEYLQLSAAEFIESNGAAISSLVSEVCYDVALLMSNRAESLFRSGGPANVSAFEEAAKWLQVAVSALDPAVAQDTATQRGSSGDAAKVLELFEDLCLRCSECCVRIGQAGGGGTSLGGSLLGAARWRRLARSTCVAMGDRNSGAPRPAEVNPRAHNDESYAKLRVTSLKSTKKVLFSANATELNPLIDRLLRSGKRQSPQEAASAADSAIELE